jgi:hypothetical protein
MAPPIRNRDVDWDAWPVQDCLTENYRQMHPADLAVIEHHSRFYREFEPDSFNQSVEFGAGPNLCRSRQPDLPDSLEQALRRVEVRRGDADSVEPDAYDLASMHFVAESVTEDQDEFRALCARFVRSARPGAPLVAAFMEKMGRYGLGDGSRWPGYPVDVDRVGDAFVGIATDVVLERIDADETLPDYGYSGMVLLTARRA